MDMKELTKKAADLIDTVDWFERENNGAVLGPGWFNVYNEKTGQSRTVVYHPESGYCFKEANEEDCGINASGRFLGTVEWLGKILTVRLPNYYIDRDNNIIAQEFVIGSSCPCDPSTNFCSHTSEMNKVTGYKDTHRGNWLIAGDEVVLFDFEI